MLLYVRCVLISSQPISLCFCVIMDFVFSVKYKIIIKECMYVSSRNYLLLVFLHLEWSFLYQISTCLMPLKFPLDLMVAIPISALLVRIQRCSLCKDKQTNGEVRGQFLLISLIHCMPGIRERLQRHCLDVKRLTLNSGRPYCRTLRSKKH